ncbi:MAG: carbohydrate kinase family protein [Spirochaetota bacterium]
MQSRQKYNKVQRTGKRVLFVGDINVDIVMDGLESLPVPDREITATSFLVTMGSTAVFTACAYSCLGGKSALAGLAGNDDYGKFMISSLKDFGVDTRLIERTDSIKTGVTLNLMYGGRRIQVTYPGTIAAFDGSNLFRLDFKKFRHIHFSGVYLQTAFKPRLPELLGIIRKSGLSASLDTQWDATETWEGLKSWLPLVNYFFMNEDEVLSYTAEESVEKAWHELSKQTACPIIKLGSRGALVSGKSGNPERIPGFKVDVVDTIGAGDSFAAGFLFGTLNRKMDPPEAVRFGNAVAARSCMFTGGAGARSTCEDIIKFMENYNE